MTEGVLKVTQVGAGGHFVSFNVSVHQVQYVSLSCWEVIMLEEFG